MATVALLCITLSAFWWCLRVSKSSDVDEERNGDLTDLSNKAQRGENESTIETRSCSTGGPQSHEKWDGKIF